MTSSFVGQADDVFEGERGEGDSLAAVKLVLKFDPVETEGVKKSGKSLHRQQDRNRQHGEEYENEEKSDGAGETLHSETDM